LTRLSCMSSELFYTVLYCTVLYCTVLNLLYLLYNTMGDSRSSETEIRCCCLFKDSGRKNDHREEGAVIHGDNKIDFCNKYNGDFGDCPVSTSVLCGGSWMLRMLSLGWRREGGADHWDRDWTHLLRTRHSTGGCPVSANPALPGSVCVL